MQIFKCDCGVPAFYVEAFPVRCACGRSVESEADPGVKRGKLPPPPRKPPPIVIHPKPEPIVPCKSCGYDFENDMRAIEVQEKVQTLSFDSIDLVRHKSVGDGLHRAGWPYVVESLQKHPRGKKPIVFDDFIEKTFIYDQPASPRVRPWAGIFHHPPDIPKWTGEHRGSIDALFSLPAFRQSLPYLQTAFALSEHLAADLRPRLDCPVVSLKYAGPENLPQWNLTKWRRNPEPKLMQLGWYMRNTRAIFQVPPDLPCHRTRYWPELAWVDSWDRRCEQLEAAPEHPGVTTRPLLSDDEYDAALASNVVLCDLMAASANTVIVECIARATPIVTNRHPAAVEYLGSKYPLFFGSLREVPKLLHISRLHAAHAYLTRMDRSWLSSEVMREKILESIRR